MGKQITPPGYHEVEQGDWLSKLAVWYGFAKWQTIWDAAENTEIRKKRDPNVIYPGDKIWIPAQGPKEESGGTEKKHRYGLKGQPDEITIILEDDKSQPRSGVKFEFNLKSKAVTKGSTSGDGKAQSKVPRHHDPAFLRVGTESVHLSIGNLNPMEADTPDKGVSGVQARLNNLGLRAGAEDGILGPRTRRAILLFQKIEKIKEDGDVTDELRGKLRMRHGI